jgi:hypothetical protein
MKTTIELQGYTIVIEETEGSITVSALKEDETVEEFTLEGGEGFEGEEGEDFDGEEGDEMVAFGEEEDDFDEAGEAEEGGEDFEGEEDEEEGEDFEGEEDEEDFEAEEEPKSAAQLESFSAFIRKRK